MPVERIVIAGGGTAAWLAAAALARRTPASIVVIELPGSDDSLGLPLIAESTVPATAEILAGFGLDEDELLRAGGGSFSLGRALSGWSGAGAEFHPYGETGAPIGPVAFHHLALRMNEDATAVRLANYSLAALAAQSERFDRPSASAGSVLSTIGYGLHFDTARLREALRGDALARGASAYQGAIDGLVMGPDGPITAVALSGGEHVHGDLFLDCTGPAAALIRRMPDAQFEDWRQWLPCDAAVVSRIAVQTAPLPYAHTAAHPAGYTLTVPVQGKVGEVTICQSAAIERFEAEPCRFVQGRQAAPWLGNCLAIGGAAAQLEPLGATPLHLAASAIARLLALFPTERHCRSEAADFNRRACEELDNARDYVIAHYKLNARQGEPLWDQCRAMALPDRLAHKIALYQGIGRIALYDEETFEASDWIALFAAMGIEPRRHDALADAIPAEQIRIHFERIRAVMLQALAQMPGHGQYLRLHGLLAA